MHTPLTLDQRTEFASVMDDLIEEHEAGWSVPVMEGFFMALALSATPPEPSVWLEEAVPKGVLSAEDEEKVTSTVLQIYADVTDFINNEDSEWMPLFAYTEPSDTALTALGFVQGMEHFASARWKAFAASNPRTAATIRKVADYALEDGKISKDQFEAAEKKFMECVFEVVTAE